MSKIVVLTKERIMEYATAMNTIMANSLITDAVNHGGCTCSDGTQFRLPDARFGVESSVLTDAVLYAAVEHQMALNAAHAAEAAEKEAQDKLEKEQTERRAAIYALAVLRFIASRIDYDAYKSGLDGCPPMPYEEWLTKQEDAKDETSI